MRAHRAGWVLGLVVFSVMAASLAVGCGGTSRAEGERLIPDLQRRIGQPINNHAESADNSRVVEKVVDSNALEGMTREDVRHQIGQGDDCSRHPRCQQLGFLDTDWYYTVGTLGQTQTQAPLLIIGFDRFGKVTRTWNLRTN